MNDNSVALDLMQQIEQEQAEQRAHLESECWFCKSRDIEEKWMWKRVRLNKPAKSYSIRLQKTLEATIEIPRCKKCFVRHTARKLVNIVFFSLPFTIGNIFAEFFLNIFGNLLPLALVCWIVQFIVNKIITKTRIKKADKKPLKYKNEYPVVLSYKQRGFKLPILVLFFRDMMKHE